MQRAKNNQGMHEKNKAKTLILLNIKISYKLQQLRHMWIKEKKNKPIKPTRESLNRPIHTQILGL